MTQPGFGAGAFSRALFACGLVLLLALFLVSSAHAETAAVQATEQDGYGRVILNFENPPHIETKVLGGVLVITFSHPVDVNVEPIGRDLPNFVSAARRDPDGRGVRLALSQPVKVNTMAAGEKLFVDIMPHTWKGMPPPLPADVIADLSRRALAAEEAKRELARAQTLPPVKMQVSAGTNEERMRLTFTFSDDVEVRFKHDDRHGILTVPGTVEFDAALARATLPPEITEFKADVIGDTMIVRFTAPEGKEMRGFNEDRAFVVDIAAPGKFEPAAAVESKPVPLAAASGPVVEVKGKIESGHGDVAVEAPEQDAEAEAPQVPATPGRPAETAALATADAVKTEPKPDVAPAAKSAPAAETVAPSDTAPAKAAANPVPGAVVDAGQVAAPPKNASPAMETASPPRATEPAKPGGSAPAAAKPAEQAAAPSAEEVSTDDPMLLMPASERATRALVEAATRDGVQVRVENSTTQIAFPFAELPGAAAFIRDRVLFVVFDGELQVDTSRLLSLTNGIFSSINKVSTGGGTALEMTMAQSRLPSMLNAENVWILSLGDTILAPTRPVHLVPTFAEDGRTSLKATKMEDIGTVHLVPDSRIGDELYVVTLKGRTRGLVREREFIEFTALPTAQGLAFGPRADDLQVRVAGEEIVLTRPKGLTLSLDAERPPLAQVQLTPGSPFAKEAWHRARVATVKTANELSRAAAASTPEERTKARVQLAKYHLANGNAAETKAILDVAASESPGLSEDADARLMRGTSLVMLRRFDEAVKVLGSGDVAANGEAALWRMVAEAGLGHIALAREAFRKGEPLLDAMPPDLQRIFRHTMIEVAIAAKDYAAAAVQLDALDMLNVAEGWAMREVFRGRIAEGFDQPAIALEAYRRALESSDERAKAEARLRSTNLRYQLAEIERKDAIANLESLAVYWRGDATEAVTLASLSELYREDHRWREAFSAMRSATKYYPKQPSTLALQDKMTAEFARLFLGDSETAAPPTLESVALFYDFKELTPPGRKGDELIRNLADRLVEVDLLTQAADLLTYQINNRLQGAARAQVAAHAAAIELMDRKPGRALNVLHDTRFVGLPPELVRRRLVLEARALSELQRPDLALEMIAAYEGDDINRLRADIQWAAHSWQAAAEALEVMLGETWRKTEPLTDEERQDVLRTAIAYALAEDSLGLDRLRAKYGPQMEATADEQTFNVVTAPEDARGEEFLKIAKAVSVADTLKRFLEDYRARYPNDAPPVVRMKENAKPEQAADANKPA